MTGAGSTLASEVPTELSGFDKSQLAQHHARYRIILKMLRFDPGNGKPVENLRQEGRQRLGRKPLPPIVRSTAYRRCSKDRHQTQAHRCSYHLFRWPEKKPGKPLNAVLQMISSASSLPQTNTQGGHVPRDLGLRDVDKASRIPLLQWPKLSAVACIR